MQVNNIPTRNKNHNLTALIQPFSNMFIFLVVGICLAVCVFVYFVFNGPEKVETTTNHGIFNAGGYVSLNLLIYSTLV